MILGLYSGSVQGLGFTGFGMHCERGPSLRAYN